MSEYGEAIEAALKEHPLSQQILQFLIEHDGTMDTIDGVAKCWVNSDPVAVKSVLDSLQYAGVVVTRARPASRPMPCRLSPRPAGPIHRRASRHDEKPPLRPVRYQPFHPPFTERGSPSGLPWRHKHRNANGGPAFAKGRFPSAPPRAK